MSNSNTSSGIGLTGLLIVVQIVLVVLWYAGTLNVPTAIVFLPAIIVGCLTGLGLAIVIAFLGGAFLVGVIKSLYKAFK